MLMKRGLAACIAATLLAISPLAALAQSPAGGPGPGFAPNGGAGINAAPLNNDPVPPIDIPSAPTSDTLSMPDLSGAGLSTSPAPTAPLPLAPLLPTPIDPGALLKPAFPTAPRQAPARVNPRAVELQAKLTDDGTAIPSGMVWRVFSEKRGGDGHLPLVREQRGGTVRLDLPPGNYIVNAAYGRAAVTRTLSVTGEGGHDTFVLNAGGLKLTAVNGKDLPITPALSKFDIYPGTDETDQETSPIASDVAPEQLVRLTAGIYHVVSRYGDANAAVRADIKVDAGKLVEATLFQKAARITLKLVADSGGEALANTSWSVLTPGGDSVFDSVGAFPDVVLAIGDYTAVAKHDNQIHERNFTVEAGRDREVEVLVAAKDGTPSAPTNVSPTP
ncbi:hypothetical protein SAMN02745157_2162 [Kaistia soli DSM 19436]|uniref:Carboxypeptidase regulatory-like domain-containing protein n=1 Tax=Kaistia soli DSM 19436 TaxID=1122133 RepID=A0A1M5AKJ7_9HYPH|nr:hypothetical protein [Kaistia soli]SHF30676.1 hypothetical protein SAMN02745157_2162 [Kaistia soli DSM 19436]